MKRSFFQAAVVSMLEQQYLSTTALYGHKM